MRHQRERITLLRIYVRSPDHHSPSIADKMRRRRYRGTRLLFESALIVLSVLLGFALNEWRQYRAERALAATVLLDFQREINLNLQTLEQSHPKHRDMAERLAIEVEGGGAGESAFHVLVQQMPEDGLHLIPMRDAAWETAVSTGALRLLEYETAALLSHTYLVQRAGIQSTLHRISDRFHDPRNFDPGSRDVVLRSHHMLLRELSGQGTYLMEIYRNALEQLSTP